MPLRAAATVGAFTDLEAVMTADERSRKAATAIWPDFELRRDEIVRTRSARHWAAELRVPLLILHGGLDRTVSAGQSLDLAQRLQALGRPYELHVFRRGSHTLGEMSGTRDSLVVAWFRAHLAP
jgi:dipeptidyl aminopeptidase/acylaminoacyl peptidase